MDTQHYLKNVTTLQLDQGKCNGCRMCLAVCPHGVFEIENKRATIVKKDSCMECGACQLNCPREAITVKQGVGCAAAIIWGALTGREPACG
ncbi:MAG: 4Fe-4S dicluster domain-containing protein [Spirochaetales bacterium]|nr:4Fe-4S dicluster domain-containing protein [Spirochaetales bacterium]